MTVTTAGLNRDRGIPRQRLLVAALAISVALNVCVVAGALWARYSSSDSITASERFRRLEVSLNLNDQQRQAFEAYVVATRARSAQLRKDIEPLMETSWHELAKAQPDEAAILQSLADASSHWRASQRETIQATVALLATLTPEQRAKFIADERARRAELRRRRADEAR